MYLGTPPAATAAPMTYELVGVTAAFGSGVDTLTGTYTFDPSGPTLDSVDITVSGPVGSGHYTVPASPVSHNLISADALNSIPLFVAGLQMQLDNGFGLSVPDGVAELLINVCPLSFGCVVPPDTGFEETVLTTGQSVPVATPIPTALPLFATGIGGLGLLGWRRKRKQAA